MISSNHHYIPQFYLHGFTNSNNQFKIWDVKKQCFKQNGGFFSPKTHFFEKDANTIIINNVKDDFLEQKISQAIDTKAALLINKIRNTPHGQKFDLIESDFVLMEHFIGSLYWGLPANYKILKNLLLDNNLKNIGMILKDKRTNKEVFDEQFENKIKADPNFSKFLRFGLPLLNFIKSVKNEANPLTFQALSDKKMFPSICSDNPILFRKGNNNDVYSDDLIFPVSNNIIFIRAKRINNISVSIKLDIDLLTYKQAETYVCCVDEKYIETLEKYFNSRYNSVNELRESIFHQLFDEQ